MMFPVLNDAITRRFTYYFDRKLAPSHRNFSAAVRHVAWVMALAVISLSWIPVEHFVTRQSQKERLQQKMRFAEDVHTRLAETDHVYQIISSFETGLSKRSERQLASLITDQAREYHLDPYLILAVIKTESFFYNGAVSSAGAQGLMQVMPPVGQELAGKLAIPYKGAQPLFQPMVNVRLGIYYLSWLIDHFQGDVELALLAYNRGPNALKRALYAGQDVPNHYVDRVLLNYHRFLKQRNDFEARQVPRVKTAAWPLSGIEF